MRVRETREQAVDRLVLAFLRDGAPSIGSVVYHYTGEEGFRGILTSKCFRAFSMQSMGAKDAEETKHGLPVVYRALRALPAKYQAIVDAASRLWRDRTLLNGENVGIACFTSERDGVRHWIEHGRCYEQVAYCLGFELVANEDINLLPDVGVGLMPVRYNEERFVAAISKTACRIAQRGRDRAPGGIARIAETACVTFKRPDLFAWEREYRLVGVTLPGCNKWLTGNGRKYLDIPARPEGRSPRLACVMVMGSDEDCRRAEEFLRELRYGLPGGEPMPPVVRSAVVASSC